MGSVSVVVYEENTVSPAARRQTPMPLGELPQDLAFVCRWLHLVPPGSTYSPRPRDSQDSPGGEEGPALGSYNKKQRDALLEKITIKVQSWIVNYFHNRIVENYCTFPAPLTSGTMGIVPKIL